MKIQSLKLAYFSPTGTTKSIVQAIARGINQDAAEEIDIGDNIFPAETVGFQGDEKIFPATRGVLDPVKHLIAPWTAASPDGIVNSAGVLDDRKDGTGFIWKQNMLLGQPQGFRGLNRIGGVVPFCRIFSIVA